MRMSVFQSINAELTMSPACAALHEELARASFAGAGQGPGGGKVGVRLVAMPARTEVDPLSQELPLVHLLQLHERAGEEVHAGEAALTPASCASCGGDVTLLRASGPPPREEGGGGEGGPDDAVQQSHVLPALSGVLLRC